MVETQVPLSARLHLFCLLWITAFVSIFFWQRNSLSGPSDFGRHRQVSTLGLAQFPRLRARAFDLTEFGAAGDGITVNTAAFERAVRRISGVGRRGGGGQLNVPPGRWLTGPFNLTSHMTLSLAEGAVILGIQVL